MPGVPAGAGAPVGAAAGAAAAGAAATGAGAAAAAPAVPPPCSYVARFGAPEFDTYGGDYSGLRDAFTWGAGLGAPVPHVNVSRKPL